jgi:hypothetical protein
MIHKSGSQRQERGLGRQMDHPPIIVVMSANLGMPCCTINLRTIDQTLSSYPYPHRSVPSAYSFHPPTSNRFMMKTPTAKLLRRCSGGFSVQRPERRGVLPPQTTYPSLPERRLRMNAVGSRAFRPTLLFRMPHRFCSFFTHLPASNCLTPRMAMTFSALWSAWSVFFAALTDEFGL